MDGSRFNYLLKKRSKALRVFQKARDNLKSIIENIAKEKSEAQALIEKRRKEIEDEEQAIKFLEHESGSLQEKVDKLDSLFG